MALALYLVLLGSAVPFISCIPFGRRHHGPRGPMMGPPFPLPLIPLKPFPPPPFFKGFRRFPHPPPFFNRHMMDLAQPFPPYGGPRIIDNRHGYSIPLNYGGGGIGPAQAIVGGGGPIFDQGVGYDFIDAGGVGSASASAAASAGGIDGYGIGGGVGPASASAAASAGGIDGYGIGGGAAATASAAASAGGPGIDVIGGDIGVGAASAVSSGVGGIDIGGPGGVGTAAAGSPGGVIVDIAGVPGPYDIGLEPIGFRGYKRDDRGYKRDDRGDNGGRWGYDNGYDNGYKRIRYGSKDNFKDIGKDNGWKIGNDDGFGGVIVGGGDTTIVHLGKPGDSGFIGTGPGTAFGTRVTYGGGPDVFDGTGVAVAASASASAGTAVAVPAVVPATGTAASASASAAATGTSSGLVGGKLV